MASAELLGGHSHSTLSDVQVQIWQRDGKFIARGRWQGKAFGKTLGDTEARAAAELRQLLTELDHGSFARPSDTRKSAFRTGPVPKLTLRQICNEFISEKRRTRGRDTAATYASRLSPVLDFAEQIKSQQRWRWAYDIDRDFVVALRAFLHNYCTTRNGRAGGQSRLLSAAQIVNILECIRTALAWARRADVRKLPAEWINPLTPDLIGKPPEKDPLRQSPLPLSQRIGLIQLMDPWQLCQLSLSLALPLRPGEAAGLLISDIDYDERWLKFGPRFGGADFTKGRTAFVIPFPPELVPILRECTAGRSDGPLLRCRQSFEGSKQFAAINSRADIEQLFRERLQSAKHDEIFTDNDRKQMFRQLMAEIGGVTRDQLAAEFRRLAEAAGAVGVSLKTTRTATTQDMEDCGIRHLELRYLTSHTVNDIINNYAGLNPVAEMQKYFAHTQPLLAAIAQRAAALGVGDLTSTERA